MIEQETQGTETCLGWKWINNFESPQGNRRIRNEQLLISGEMIRTDSLTSEGNEN